MIAYSEFAFGWRVSSTKHYTLKSVRNVAPLGTRPIHAQWDTGNCLDHEAAHRRSGQSVIEKVLVSDDPLAPELSARVGAFHFEPFRCHGLHRGKRRLELMLAAHGESAGASASRYSGWNFAMWRSRLFQAIPMV